MHHSIDITPLTHLRSIQFVFRCGRRANENDWIMYTLSQMSSVHLEDVVFHLIAVDWGADISGALRWSEVDAILQCSTFS
jgi:hypothetical protein